MKNLFKILLLALGLIILVVVVRSLSGDKVEVVNEQTVPEEEPIDIVLDFYNSWLKAILSTTTDPYAANLHNSPLLSDNLKTELATGQTEENFAVDKVLCQSVVPPRIGAKPIFSNDTEGQVMVLPRGSDEAGMAIVTVVAKAGEWVLDKIECSMGDVLPEREFSFSYEGYLLKDSLSSLLNSENWHLIFVQDGEPGHAVPLFFDESSACYNETGESLPCLNERFTEAAKVYVKGEMTESGVAVKYLDFVD